MENLKESWTNLSLWKKFILFLIIIIIIVNIYALLDVTIVWLKTGNSTCPRGFAGYTECKLWQSILSVSFLLNFIITIPLIIILSFIFVIIKLTKIFKNEK